LGHQCIHVLTTASSRRFGREMHDIFANRSDTAQTPVLVVARTPAEAFERLEEGDVDVFVIEMSPTATNEPDWIKGMRSFDPWLPVVAVLDLEDGQAERRAVDAGADACLAMDGLCEGSLLRAIFCAIERRQIRALASRGASGVARVPLFRFGCFELDEANLVLRKRGKPVRIHLTPLRLLIHLVRNADRTVSRRELLDTVWSDAAVSDCAISSALKELRHALGDDGFRQRLIETRRGRGYRFIGGVSEPGGEQRIKTVAVLPFECFSSDCDCDCFVAGLLDALIDEMSRVTGVRTIARTSVMRCGALQEPVSEIAATLGADAIVTGTIVCDGHSVRTSPQLLDGRTEQLLWSDHYDREFGKQLELESELASAIVDEIRLEVSTGNPPRTQGSRVRKATGARKRVREPNRRRDPA
jgi:TolB-like protein/DNA-binding response OmpR family regulator